MRISMHATRPVRMVHLEPRQLEKEFLNCYQHILVLLGLVRGYHRRCVLGLACKGSYRNTCTVHRPTRHSMSLVLVVSFN
jgi:hypothetical protein